MRSAFRQKVAALVLVAAVGGCRDDGEDTPADDDGAASTGEASDDSGSDGSGSTGEADTGESGESGGSEETGEGIGEGPWDTFEERPCPDDSFVTFENFGWPHMLTFCNGCHSSMLPADMRQGAPIEINFESIEDVREHAARIWARSGDQHTTMPPVGPAADDERYLLGEWLACGAPTDADLMDE